MFFIVCKLFGQVFHILGQPPVLQGIPNNGLCDIRRQDCVRTRVTGDDFIDDPALSCRMTEAKVCEYH